MGEELGCMPLSASLCFTFHKDSEETVAIPELDTLGGLSESVLLRSPFSIHSNLYSVSDHHSDSSLLTTTVHQEWAPSTSAHPSSSGGEVGGGCS